VQHIIPSQTLSKNASLDLFSHLLRVFWLRWDLVDDSPVLTPMESTIEINIFSNGEAAGDLPGVPVDKSLQACLISKSLVNRLRVSYEATPGSTVTDATGRTHTVIGKVELRWNRRDSAKSHPQRFLVVDSLPTHVILGASALPKSRESDVHPTGVGPQSEGTAKLIPVYSTTIKLDQSLWLTDRDIQNRKGCRRRREKTSRPSETRRRTSRQRKKSRNKPRGVKISNWVPSDNLESSLWCPSHGRILDRSKHTGR